MLAWLNEWLRDSATMIGRRRSIAGFAAIAVAGFAAVATLDSSIDDLIGEALKPVARLPMPDDGAGDATMPGDGDGYLSLPEALADERVVAAFGPIANLSCKRSDYANDQEAPPVVSDLGTADFDSEAYAWIDRHVTAAAFAPLTELPDGSGGDAAPSAESAARDEALAAPLSAPASAVDAMLTRNLLGAALSPIAALPAPEAEAAPIMLADASPSGNCPALLRHTFNRLQTGQPQSFCQFQGKVLLIVNTASYCGYTPQYEALEALYRKYKDRGLVVVGFPSNDFGRQEPGSNNEIAEFCRTTYGVQFPMFEKSSVARLDANALYVELAKESGAAPKWNFHKYVVDRSGTHVTSFASDVTPDSAKLVDLVERLLAESPEASKG